MDKYDYWLMKGSKFAGYGTVFCYIFSLLFSMLIKFGFDCELFYALFTTIQHFTIFFFAMFMGILHPWHKY